MAGTIPASWILNPAAFTALQLLDLSTNDLRGSLPQDGWQYGKFRWVHLLVQMTSKCVILSC